MRYVSTMSTAPSVTTGNSTGGVEPRALIASGDASVGTAMTSTPMIQSRSYRSRQLGHARPRPRQGVEHDEDAPPPSIVAERARSQRGDRHGEVGRDQPGPFRLDLASDPRGRVDGAKRPDEVDHVPPLRVPETTLETRHAAPGDAVGDQPEDFARVTP